MLKNFNSQNELSLSGWVLDQVSFLSFQVQTGQPFFVLQSVIKSNKNIYYTQKKNGILGNKINYIYKNPQRRLFLFCINLTLLILRLNK